MFLSQKLFPAPDDLSALKPMAPYGILEPSRQYEDGSAREDGEWLEEWWRWVGGEKNDYGEWVMLRRMMTVNEWWVIRRQSKVYTLEGNLHTWMHMSSVGFKPASWLAPDAWRCLWPLRTTARARWRVSGLKTARARWWMSGLKRFVCNAIFNSIQIHVPVSPLDGWMIPLPETFTALSVNGHIYDLCKCFDNQILYIILPCDAFMLQPLEVGYWHHLSASWQVLR